MLSTKPAAVTLKTLKGDWTERSAHHAVASWLSLSPRGKWKSKPSSARTMPWRWARGKLWPISPQPIASAGEKVPFTGCDGVTKTGQEWVRRGLLKATIITAPAAGTALELL